MARIGIVDLDTSHPASWVPIERELGNEVAGLWDGGSVHGPAYARDFAGKWGIPRIYGSLAEMAGDVDLAIIHGCDWDTHVAKARPFVEAGKSVLIDKPLAGNIADLAQIRRWCGQGARITGGSSLRFCRETQQWLALPVEQRGAPHTVFCGCAVDDFNYGIHAYSMLSGIMGCGVRTVRHLGRGVQRRVQLSWEDGRMGIVVVGQAAKWQPFYASIVTERSCVQYQPAADGLYRAFLETVLPYLSGRDGGPPLAAAELVEPELCALAARRSWLEGDRPVSLSELSEDDRYDGKAFAEEYRRSKYPP